MCFILQSVHMALMEAVQVLYVKEVVVAERVVAVLRSVAPATRDDNATRDDPAPATCHILINLSLLFFLFFLQSAHMALMEADQVLYVKEVVVAECVVAALRSVAPATRDDQTSCYYSPTVGAYGALFIYSQFLLR